MDVVASLLEGPRARDAFVIRTHMETPWGLSIEDEAALTIVVILQGRARLEHPSRGEKVELDSGDLVLVQGGAPYVIADTAGTSPRLRILPGNRPVTMAGDEIGSSMNLGVRTWGAAGTDEVGAEASARLHTGRYEDVGEASRRLLDAIPTVVLRPDAVDGSAYVRLLADEALTDAPGQSAVLDRLLDLVLVDTVRHHFDVTPEDAPRWYSALGDDLVGDALRLIHADPAAEHSVASLAAVVGASRATLSRRFAAAVGESPMAYVKRWRMSLAADRLADPDLTVARVAELVGYRSPFTFSNAFKAYFGRSPSHYRQELRQPDARARGGSDGEPEPSPTRPPGS